MTNFILFYFCQTDDLLAYLTKIEAEIESNQIEIDSEPMECEEEEEYAKKMFATFFFWFFHKKQLKMNLMWKEANVKDDKG